jgi:hypothetical protein
MKKTIGLLCSLLCCISLLNAQDMNLDAYVKKAVDDLATKANLKNRVNIYIEPIVFEKTETVSGLSEALGDLIKHYAVNNGLYNVKETPVSMARAPAGPGVSDIPRAKISGSFLIMKNLASVTILFVNTAAGSILSSSKFTIAVSELEKLGIEIFPQNLPSQDDVEKQQKHFTNYDGSKNDFKIMAWTDSPNRIYRDGDKLYINIESERDCEVMVYHVNVYNEMQCIFPNELDLDKRLFANQIKRIPTNKNVSFNLGAPYGEERILVYASDNAFEIPQDELNKVQTITRDTNAVDLPNIRGLNVDYGKATAQFTFTINPTK